MDTVVVRRMTSGPVLVIEGAAAAAEAFFTLDASTVGPDSYDAWAGRTDPNRITTADVSAMNRTMRARSPHTAWAAYTGATEDLAPLAAIGRDWSLLEMEPDEWADRQVADRLEALMLAVKGPYRNLAV